MPGKKQPYSSFPESKKIEERRKARERYWIDKQAYLDEYGKPDYKLRVYNTKYGVIKP